MAVAAGAEVARTHPTTAASTATDRATHPVRRVRSATVVFMVSYLSDPGRHGVEGFLAVANRAAPRPAKNESISLTPER
ncbi:hypothetical protein GCM10027262_65230 [Nocardia tengchongensis]